MMMKTIYQAISPDPATFDSKPKQRALQKAIQGLPADEQEILDLHFKQQVSIKDIALQKRCSMTPIYKRLNTALFKLTKQFYPEAFAKAKEIMYGHL